MKSILIIDDEPAIRKMLKTALGDTDIKTFEADCAEAGLREIALKQPDLVLLDLGLPDMDGIEALRRIREWSKVPVIVITVRDDPEEKITALDSGAQDYVTKPFHTGELLARIRAVCKRESEQSRPIVEYAGISFDFITRTVRVNGELVSLTRTEYNIFKILMQNKNCVVSKNYIIRSVWGEISSSVDDQLRVHIAALRKKFKQFGLTDLIKTETGIGYRM